MTTLVLVADADPFNLRLLSEACSTLGCEAISAADGVSVLDAVARQRPDLVLMDADLPGMNGLQVLQVLKGDAGYVDVPVVLATRDDDESTRMAGLQMGAEDYISRPYRTFEIQQRVRNALRMRRAGNGADGGGTLTADPVTGAGTPAQLFMSLDYEFTRAVRYGHAMSCVVVRCENYSAILLRSGQQVSESDVLVPLSVALRSCIRNVDHLFRSAAGEFSILLPETGEDGCQIVVERLQTRIAEADLFASELSPRPDISVSATSYPTQTVRDGEALWKQAVTARSA